MTSKLLTEPQLILAGLLLAISNFIVVLDMTITNVSIPHIAGGLGVSMIEGTNVITSYAVAEAIIVPLTGWLAVRFGTLRVFTWGMTLFGVCSTMCGLAQNLNFLVFSRILQGLAGGPLMPLSQTLLLSIFPKDKQAAAIGIWGMTTLIAPVLGPIVGGYICDNWAWSIIFYLNIPIAIICSILINRLLKSFETEVKKVKVDYIGLLLLLIWVGALQLMLDEGKYYDWFESKYIMALLLISIIGFIAFLIWELTEQQPIVNLRVFKQRGYTLSVLTICVTFGAFFGAIVLTPLWLQSTMDYTATWAGLVAALIGVLAVFMAPLVASLSTKVDPRLLVFCGIMWMAMLTFYRSNYTVDMTYTQIAIPVLIQGIGMPFFFLPLTSLALSNIASTEIASAAGLMNFSRTLAGAFATSIVTTFWEKQAISFRTGIVDIIGHKEIILSPPFLERLVDIQSFTLAINRIFFFCSLLMVIAALLVWMVPKPKLVADMVAVH